MFNVISCAFFGYVVLNGLELPVILLPPHFIHLGLIAQFPIEHSPLCFSWIFLKKIWSV